MKTKVPKPFTDWLPIAVLIHGWLQWVGACTLFGCRTSHYHVWRLCSTSWVGKTIDCLLADAGILLPPVPGAELAVKLPRISWQSGTPFSPSTVFCTCAEDTLLALCPSACSLLDPHITYNTHAGDAKLQLAAGSHIQRLAQHCSLPYTAILAGDAWHMCTARRHRLFAFSCLMGDSVTSLLHLTMRFGITTQVLAKRMLQYYR